MDRCKVKAGFPRLLHFPPMTFLDQFLIFHYNLSAYSVYDRPLHFSVFYCLCEYPQRPYIIETMHSYTLPM